MTQYAVIIFEGAEELPPEVLEARDLDHALALAKLTPIVKGGVEVRPLIGFGVMD